MIKDRNEWIPRNRYARLHLLLPMGYRCNKLTIVEWLGRTKGKKYVYRCRCDCGGEARVVGSYLKQKRARGCIRCRTGFKAASMTKEKKHRRRKVFVHEIVLSMSSDYIAKDIAKKVRLSPRRVADILVMYGLKGYRVRKRGAPGIPRRKQDAFDKGCVIETKIDFLIQEMGENFIGLWQFRNYQKPREWCVTYQIDGYYYDTYPQKNAVAALRKALIVLKRRGRP